MTIEEVEGILQQIHEFELEISEAAQKRDASIGYFQSRIATAEKNYDNETKYAKMEIERLSGLLEEYLKENPPKGRKSIQFGGGIIGQTKRDPILSFEDGQPLNADNKKLLEYAKVNAENYVKLKISVDWENLKKQLVIVGENVCMKDTGEVIEGLRAKARPDKFWYKLTE